MSDKRVTMQWHLRQVMAERGIFTTSDLVPLLAERGVNLSRQYVHRLVTTAPNRINTDLLAALCDILGCGPSDLLEPVVETVQQTRTGTGEHSNETRGIGELRPIRAQVRRPKSTE